MTGKESKFGPGERGVMPNSVRERYIAALEKEGETRVEGRTRKYVVMTRKRGGFYFIGKCGSLRWGHKATVSLSVSKQRKAALLNSVD